MNLLTGLLLVLGALPLLAGPVEFGTEELNAALQARHLKLRIAAEIGQMPPESFQIEQNRIRGGDVRGLLYGLLEAADQIRRSGRLTPTVFSPATALRGIRLKDDRRSNDDWQALLRDLARLRFNRVTLLCGEACQDVPRLRRLSQAAAGYSIDFVLGPSGSDFSFLKKILAECPAIRGVQLQSEAESAAAVFQAIREAGRRVIFDFTNWAANLATIDRAASLGVPLQLSARAPGCQPAGDVYAGAYVGSSGFELDASCYDSHKKATE